MQALYHLNLLPRTQFHFYSPPTPTLTQLKVPEVFQESEDGPRWFKGIICLFADALLG